MKKEIEKIRKGFDSIIVWFLREDGECFLFISAVASLGWAIQLLNPFTTSIFSASAFNYFLEIYPSEEAWGILMLVSGVLCPLGYYMKNKGIQQLGLSGILFFRVLSFVFLGLKYNFSSPSIFDSLMWSSFAAIAMLKAKGGKNGV